MHPPRATLATTCLLLVSLVSCAEQAVVPTEPSRVAPMTSIPGSSSVTVRTGQEAEQFLAAAAETWSRNGDTRLSQALETQRTLTVLPDGRVGPRTPTPSPTRPNLALTDGVIPSPTTTPNAIIYYSSTSPYVSGRSAPIVSSVTYFGNIATSTVTYGAYDSQGADVIPRNVVANRGTGDYAPCIGSQWECSWTFKLQTVIALDLGKDCGVTVWASANHTAQWTTPSISKLPAATWGSAYAGDSRAFGNNGACAPPPICLQAGASNYGGALPCTFPPPPPTSPTGGDGSTPPSTGGTTEPVTYQPAPFVPSGHWECYQTFVGTDTQTEVCTWYADYARLPKSSPAFALTAGTAAARTLTAADLPSVFVIVSDQVPADAMAVIERHKQGPFKNVLLVPSSTIRPAVLVAALQALANSRGTHGETPDKEFQLTLKGGILDQQIPASARDYATTFTALIANAKRGDAGTYGQRPILELRLGDKK